MAAESGAPPEGPGPSRYRPQREYMRALPPALPHDAANLRLEPEGVGRPKPLALAKIWDRLPDLVLARFEVALWRRRYQLFLKRPEGGHFEYRRSDRLEALVLVLRVIVAHLDLRTMRVLVDAPDEDDSARGLSLLDYSTKTRLSEDRLQAVFEDLKTLGLEQWKPAPDGRRLPQAQPRVESPQRPGDPAPGTASRWTALPAIRIISKELFGTFGLAFQFQRDRDHASKCSKAKRRQNKDDHPVGRSGAARPRRKPRPTKDYEDIAQGLSALPGALAYAPGQVRARPRPDRGTGGNHQPISRASTTTAEVAAELTPNSIEAKVPEWRRMPLAKRLSVLCFLIARAHPEAWPDEAEVQREAEALLRRWHPELFDECPF